MASPPSGETGVQKLHAERIKFGALDRLRLAEWRPPWQFRVGMWTYGTGLVLLFAGSTCFATAIYFGNKVHQPRFDPQQREVVIAEQPEYMQIANTFGFTSIGCGVLAPVTLLGGFGFLFAFLYQAWRTIDDGRTTVSPGMAVGLLLVPLFNFYWVFVGLAGLPREMSAFRRHHLSSRRPSNLLGVVVGVLYILGCVPVLGFGPLLLCLLLFPVFFRSIAQSLTALSREAQSLGNQLPPFDATDLVEIHWPPISHFVMTIAASLLGVLGMELLLIGGIGSVAAGRDYLRERRQVAAAEAAVAFFRSEADLPPPELERLRAHEAEIDRWQRSSGVRTAMPILLAMFTAGMVTLALAAAIALIRGFFRRRG